MESKIVSWREYTSQEDADAYEASKDEIEGIGKAIDELERKSGIPIKEVHCKRRDEDNLWEMHLF